MSDEYDVFKKCDYSFDDTFGTFKPRSVTEPTYKPSIVKRIDDGRAHPCNHCGDYPSTHEVCFKDKESHEKNIYIVCEICGESDGKWYATEEEAIKEWNEMNPLTKVEFDKMKHDTAQFIKDIVNQSKFGT